MRVPHPVIAIARHRHAAIRNRAHDDQRQNRRPERELHFSIYQELFRHVTRGWVWPI